MTRQEKVNAKPSQAHNNADVLRAKADEANRKRKERQAQAKREEQEARWEAENKAKDEAEARRKAQEQAKPEPEVNPEPEVKKDSANLGKKIKVVCDGVEYPTLNAALRGTGEPLWANETDYRRSCWTKINRELKKNGTSVHSGHTFSMI